MLHDQFFPISFQRQTIFSFVSRHISIDGYDICEYLKRYIQFCWVNRLTDKHCANAPAKEWMMENAYGETLSWNYYWNGSQPMKTATKKWKLHRFGLQIKTLIINESILNIKNARRFSSEQRCEKREANKKMHERQSIFIILYTEEVNNKSFIHRINEKKNATIFVLCKEEAEKLEPVYSIKVLNAYSAQALIAGYELIYICELCDRKVLILFLIRVFLCIERKKKKIPNEAKR